MCLRRTLSITSIILATVIVAAPATAHDPEGDHPGPGSAGPDELFLLSDEARASARTLPYLNPQTQMSVIG